VIQFEDEGARKSGPDEYPNFPSPPEQPELPMNINPELDNILKAYQLMNSYMRQVNTFLARLGPFVGDFQRLDGLAAAQAGLQELIEQGADMLARDMVALRAELIMLKSNIDIHDHDLEGELNAVSRDIVRLDNAYVTLNAEVETQKDLISIDDGRIKSLEAEIANISEWISEHEMYVPVRQPKE
jgi:hypothetical protein